MRRRNKNKQKKALIFEKKKTLFGFVFLSQALDANSVALRPRLYIASSRNKRNRGIFARNTQLAGDTQPHEGRSAHNGRRRPHSATPSGRVKRAFFVVATLLEEDYDARKCRRAKFLKLWLDNRRSKLFGRGECAASRHKHANSFYCLFFFQITETPWPGVTTIDGTSGPLEQSFQMSWHPKSGGEDGRVELVFNGLSGSFLGDEGRPGVEYTPSNSVYKANVSFFFCLL